MASVTSIIDAICDFSSTSMPVSCDSLEWCLSLLKLTPSGDGRSPQCLFSSVVLLVMAIVCCECLFLAVGSGFTISCRMAG